MMYQQWKGFTTGQWMKEIDVRDFIQKNYIPYEGDGSFLASASDSEALLRNADRTQKLWEQVTVLMKQERDQGILDAEYSSCLKHHLSRSRLH